MSEEPSSRASAAASSAEAAPELASKTDVNPRVKRAIALVKRNPLKAVALGAAAIAALEVEFAVGLLAGVGATALLATRPGAEARGEVLSKSKAARDEVVRKGRAAFDKAKSKLKRKEAPPPVVSVGDAPPPTG